MSKNKLQEIDQLIDACDTLNKYYDIIDKLRAYCNANGHSKETQELYLKAHDRSNQIMNAK